MSDYAQDAIDADEALREDGQLLTLTYKQPGIYVGGAVVPGVPPIIRHAWGIETGLTTNDLGIGAINGTLIKSGDRKITMSALDDASAALPPMKNEDMVLAGGVLYTVKNVDKVAPGGIVVLWRLVGRV
jgi:hypothetical protein